MNFFNIRIEIYSVIRDLIKNIWVIFMATLMGVMGIYIATKSFHTPEYTATALLVVNAKSSTSGSYSLYSTSVEMTKVISRVVVDKTVKDKAMEKLGVDEFDGVLSATVERDTNFMELSVRSHSPQVAYNLLLAVLDSYPEVSDSVFSNVVINVLKMPQMPNSPSNGISTVKRLLVIAAMTVFVAGLVVVLSILRDTVKDEGDFNNKLDAKLLGTIPHERKKFKIKGGFEFNDKPLIIHNNAFITLGFVENFHKIAAKIEHSNRRNGSKVYAVTSVVENEGKSTVAANLAISLADRGHKVILVDLDCKKPELYQLFGKKHSEKSEFSDLMTGKLKTNEFRLRRYKHSKVLIIYA
jgi:capsular polysaccharide biosynthesis protein